MILVRERCDDDSPRAPKSVATLLYDSVVCGGCDSVVGTVTPYRLDCPEIESCCA